MVKVKSCVLTFRHRMTPCASVYCVCVPDPRICFGDRCSASLNATELCGGVSSLNACGEGCWDYTKDPPQLLPAPWRMTAVRRYHLPGGHEETDATVAELAKVGTVQPAYGPVRLTPPRGLFRSLMLMGNDWITES